MSRTCRVRCAGRSIGAEMAKPQGVAHIDFPAARCKLVIGKVRNSLIGPYFLSLARFYSASATRSRDNGVQASLSAY